MDATSITTVLATALLIALVGALAGSAGFATFVVRRQNRRITELTERLASADDAAAIAACGSRDLRDRRLRAAFDRLAARIADTWRLATVDPLTGILNRQAVLGRLADELTRSARYRRALSVVVIDLDHFKRLNDSYGHAAGDLVLHDVARTLDSHLRGVDVVGRYGGEEFLLVLPETDVEAAATLAEKLRRLVGSLAIELPSGDPVAITMSAGVAGGTGEALRLDDLIRDADAALYSAKALGRNQVYVFREMLEDGLIPRAMIAPAARRQAIDVGRAAMLAAQEALTGALDGRAAWAGGPSHVIAEASTTLARSIGLSDGEIDRIRAASLLHDLGKLAIPDDILEKPGELAEPEWRVVAEHPKIGQVVLEQAGALRDAATIVLHHHEWYDGRGYPLGLAGADIPIGARIVAVVDAYEAMVAGRPYRAAVDHETAIGELRRQAGVQFDPEIVAVFVALFEKGLPWPIERRREIEAVGPGLGQGPHGGEPSLADAHDAVHALRRRVTWTGTG